MIIRKLFRFESAHIVRNCYSERCRENIHGHSYTAEIFINSDKLDKGFMVMDFSLLYLVKELIDSFDHSYLLWNEENDDFKSFIRKYSARVIELPFSPTAETISIMLCALIDRILSNMEFKNGEGNVQLSAVRIHETVTGYAEATRADLGMLPFDIRDIRFSESIRNVWQNDILSRIG